MRRVVVHDWTSRWTPPTPPVTKTSMPAMWAAAIVADTVVPPDNRCWPMHTHSITRTVSSVLVLFLIMAALRSRCGHYILQLWFPLSSSFFFFLLLFLAYYQRSQIGCLSYGMWLQREFRMHVWNVLHEARWKYRTQKIAVCAPSRSFVGLYLRN